MLWPEQLMAAAAEGKRRPGKLEGSKSRMLWLMGAAAKRSARFKKFWAVLLILANFESCQTAALNALKRECCGFSGS